MKFTILLHICTLCFINAFSNPDSLLLELKEAKTSNDVNKLIEIQSKLGDLHFSKKDYSSCISYYTSALNLIKQNELYKKNSDIFYKLGNVSNTLQKYQDALDYLTYGLNYTNNETDKAKFFHKIGQVLVDSTNYEEALTYLNQSLELYKKQEQQIHIPSVYNLIGMCYGLTNNLDKAFEAFHGSLLNNQLLKDSIGISMSYYNIGLASYFKGEYDIALDNYIKSLRIRELSKDTTTIVASLTSIGETFRQIGESAKAMNYYQHALELKPGIKNEQVLAYIYSEIGLILKRKNEYKQALAYFDTAMIHSEKGRYKRGIATLYSYMAGIQKNLKNTAKAQNLYLKSLEEYRKLNFNPGIIQSLTAIAETYISQKLFDQATQYLNEATEKVKDNGLLEEEAEIQRIKYLSYKAQNQSRQALVFFEEYQLLKDSIFNIEKEKEIQKIETLYQTEKHERMIDTLEAETKIQQQKLNWQQYFIIGLGIFTILIFLLTLLFIRQNKLKTKLLIAQNRQKLLRSQMNPHFIYNALSAIQTFILKNNSMESVSYIAEFSNLMRLVLNNSVNDLVNLKNDQDFINHYLRLQQLRFNHTFTFTIKSDEKINPELIKIPPMLTQPFIENAVEHGMRKMNSSKGHIQINYQQVHNTLIISILDNGPGFFNHDNTTKDHEPMAIKITKERLENIEKLLRLKIKLEIKNIKEPKSSGAQVIFTIPLR